MSPPSESDPGVCLQDFVPCDRDLRWRLHTAYYAQRGLAAWTQADIPHWATSNAAFARQHARLFVALVAALERDSVLVPGQDVAILEVGAGAGLFAIGFLRALETACGPAGAAVARRCRYFVSDRARTTVAEAAARPALAERVASGRVTPCVLDIDTLTPCGLDGAPLTLPPLVAIVANYLCCVVPAKVIGKSADGWSELFVRTRHPAQPGESPDGVLARLFADPTAPGLLAELTVEREWRPVDLAHALPHAAHARVVEAALAPVAAGTLSYPTPFIDFLRHACRALLVAGGLFLISDFGSGAAEDLGKSGEDLPLFYGNSINNRVSFALLDHTASALGLDIVRTGGRSSSLYHAALAAGGTLTPDVRVSFTAEFVESQPGQDLLDFAAAARAASSAQDPALAARFYRRALRLDPFSVKLHRELGRACLAAGETHEAIRVLTAGHALDSGADATFGLLLAEACKAAGDARAALTWLAQALTIDPQAATYLELALAYETLNEPDDAALAYEHALGLDPACEPAQRCLARLRNLPGPPQPTFSGHDAALRARFHSR